MSQNCYYFQRYNYIEKSKSEYKLLEQESLARLLEQNQYTKFNSKTLYK